jgi:ubiquinone/menaquinone biosynthesis C-methylase UbiE
MSPATRPDIEAADYQPFPDIPRRNLMQETLEVPALIKLLDLPVGGRVLEVGCGRGIALPPLAAQLCPDRLCGLDIDAELIDAARARLQERQSVAELQVADVRAMPYADHSFDLVIDFGTCHHIASPEAALREIVRVLRPGGLFVAETVTSQLLSHPFRSRGQRLPWHEAPELTEIRGRLLWKARLRS